VSIASDPRAVTTEQGAADRLLCVTKATAIKRNGALGTLWSPRSADGSETVRRLWGRRAPHKAAQQRTHSKTLRDGPAGYRTAVHPSHPTVLHHPRLLLARFEHPMAQVSAIKHLDIPLLAIGIRSFPPPPVAAMPRLRPGAVSANIPGHTPALRESMPQPDLSPWCPGRWRCLAMEMEQPLRVTEAAVRASGPAGRDPTGVESGVTSSSPVSWQAWRWLPLRGQPGPRRAGPPARDRASS
jgi:hypothetical protein